MLAERKPLASLIKIPSWTKCVTVGVSWFGRLATVLVQLLVIPLLLNLLDEDRYAVYQVIYSLQGWFLLCSLGIGQSLKNIISESRAKNQSDAAVRRTASFFLLLAFLGSVLIFTFVSPHLSNRLLNRLAQGENWADRPFFLAGLLMIVIGVGQVGFEVLYAEMRGHWAYLLPGLGQGIGLVLIYGLTSLNEALPGLLFWIVLFWFGPQAIAGVIALKMGGLFRMPRLHADHSLSSRLLLPAGQFFTFAFLSNAVLLVDYLVMSQVLEAREIVMYSVMMRIVNTLLVFYMTILNLTWPEWSEQLHRGEWTVTGWRVLSMSVIGVLVCGVLAVVMIPVLPSVVRIWLQRPDFPVPVITMLLFFGYLAIRVWTDTYAVALMSNNRTKWLIVTVIAQVLITLPAELFLGRLWGADGIILGLIIGFLLTATWALSSRFFGLVRNNAELVESKLSL